MGWSTVKIGNARPRVKSQAVFTQRISILIGARLFGTQANDCAVKGVPHQGHAWSGAGARLACPVRYRRTGPTAVDWSAFRWPPSWFGEASEPTHSPISIGQSPSCRRPLLLIFLGSVRIS